MSFDDMPENAALLPIMVHLRRVLGSLALRLRPAVGIIARRECPTVLRPSPRVPRDRRPAGPQPGRPASRLAGPKPPATCPPGRTCGGPARRWWWLFERDGRRSP